MSNPIPTPDTAFQGNGSPGDEDSHLLVVSRRWSEHRWWALIVSMALVDAVGFWIVLGDVVANEDRELLLLLVLGGALTSVAVPHLLGSVLRSRSARLLVWITVGASGPAWLALGLIMVVVRTQADSSESGTAANSGTGVLAEASDPTGLAGSLITALILACLYVATGAVAFRHAWVSSGRNEVEERQLSARLRRVNRTLKWERHEQEVAQQRREQAQRAADELDERRQLHLELNDAVAEVIAQEIRVAIMYETGDPAATDALRSAAVADPPPRRGYPGD